MPLDEEMQEIHRETIETHNLIIKTDNLVKNLSAEIRQIQKKQESYEKKYIFNSVVAYVLFVALIFAGLYAAFDAKVGVERKEKEALEEKLKKTRTEADELQAKLSARAQQEKIAEQFLRLRQDNREVDALKVAEGLDLNVMSPLVARLVGAEIAGVKAKVGEQSLEEGRGLYQKGEMERALRELDRAVGVQPPGPLLSKVQSLRGTIFSRLNRSAQAAEAFLAAADADPKASSAEGALLNAAGALETSGDVPRALLVYRRFLGEFPSTPSAATIRAKVVKLDTETAKKPPAPAPAGHEPAAVQKQDTKPAVDGGAPAPAGAAGVVTPPEE